MSPIIRLAQDGRSRESSLMRGRNGHDPARTRRAGLRRAGELCYICIYLPVTLAHARIAA